MILGRLAVAAATASALAAPSPAAAEDRDYAEYEDLGETPASGYWSLTLSGGAAFPLADYAEDHEQALGAQAAIAYTARFGLGVAALAGYSPLPVIDEEATGEIRDNHVAHAALAPRFTLGKRTLRLFVGAGGGVYFEQAAATKTAAAALAQAGLELHILGAGGLTVGASYLRSFADAAAQLASAHAGLVLTF